MANDLQKYVLFLLEFHPSYVKSMCSYFTCVDLSANPNITLDFVLATPNFNWDFGGLSINPNITFDMICQNFSMSFPICTIQAGQNPNITIDIIKNNLNLRWDFDRISRNPNISPDDIKKLVIEINENKTKYKNILYFPDTLRLSRYIYNNPNLTNDFVKQNLEMTWLLNNLGLCPLIALDILNYIKPANDTLKGLFISKYSKNTSLTVQNIIDNVSENWNISELASNPSFDLNTLKDLEKILNKPITQDKNIIKNPNITLDILNYDNTITNNLEEIAQIGNIIFEIASTNRFYSKMYADLYCELIEKFETIFCQP